MSEHKENVPKIRFPGFTDDWEQRRLNEVMSDFIVPMRDKPKKFNGTIPWIRLEDIEGRYINGTLSNQYVTQETIEEMNLKIIPKSSLIVSASATFGVVAIVTRDLITNQTFIGLVPKDEYDLDFLYAFFQSPSVLYTMKMKSAGSTIFYISQNEFKKLLGFFPELSEQVKIGNFFSHLDRLITLHQRKLNNVKKLKAGLFQKMLPKNGEDFPEVRFPGFTDAWEQRKVSTFSEETCGGGTPQTSNDAYWEGEIPWIQSSDLTEHEVFGVGPKKRISQLGLKNSATKLVPANSIAIITRVGVGKLAFMPFEYATSQDFLSLSKLKVDGRFAAYSLYRKLQSESHVVQGTSIKGITKDELLSKSVMVPTSNIEQVKIGDLFRDLDHFITLHQRKIEHLQKQKKSLLQQMFI